MPTVGDIVQKKNEWTIHNPWLEFPSDEEPALVLEVKGDCLKVMWLWKNYEQWQTDRARGWEVVSESR